MASSLFLRVLKLGLLLGLLLGLVVDVFFPFLIRFMIVALQLRFILCWIAANLWFVRLDGTTFAKGRPFMRLMMNGGRSDNFNVFSAALRAYRGYAG